MINISKTAASTSISTAWDETAPLVSKPFYGDSDKPNIFVSGPFAVISWVDKYCAGDKQRYISYNERGGIAVPFSCTYVSYTNDVEGGTWNTLQLTDGSRDAKSVDEKLNRLIEDIFIEYREVYGTRRIKAVLLYEYGVIVSRRKIGKIMRSLNLSVKMKRKFKVTTTDSNHNYSISPNRLQRDFKTNVSDEVYVGDITYIRTQQGWLYLAVVIDLFSRQVVGWSMDDTMKTSLVNNALQMALHKRSPPAGLIWHTDRGSQYASDEHRKLLSEHHMLQSMSRKGDCWDNAVSERFFIH